MNSSSIPFGRMKTDKKDMNVQGRLSRGVHCNRRFQQHGQMRIWRLSRAKHLWEAEESMERKSVRAAIETMRIMSHFVGYTRKHSIMNQEVSQWRQSNAMISDSRWTVHNSTSAITWQVYLPFPELVVLRLVNFTEIEATFRANGVVHITPLPQYSRFLPAEVWTTLTLLTTAAEKHPSSSLEQEKLYAVLMMRL